MHVTFTVLLLLVQDAGLSNDFARPKALLAFEQSRRSLMSGTFKWTTATAGGEIFSFRSTYAKNGDSLLEKLGDQDGWTVFDFVTKQGISKSPQRFIQTREESLKASGSPIFADRSENKEGAPHWQEELLDIRNLGVSPSTGSLNPARGFAQMCDHISGPRFERWSEERDGDLAIVTAHYEGDVRVAWFLSPEKGWNAERVLVDQGKGVVSEVRCTLEQNGDYWFPSRAEYYREGTLVDTIDINEARLNLPDDPPRFSIADFHLEAGANITHHTGGWVKDQRWNGDALCSRDEWYADVKAGKRKFGDYFVRVSRGEAPADPYSTAETRAAQEASRRAAALRQSGAMGRLAWVRYVRDFIDRFGLDAQQTQRAELILHRCERQADEYEVKKKREFDEIADQLLRPDAKKPDRAAELKERLDKLNAPVDAIFERELKPKLEKLPTRKQREAAGNDSASPTSRPAEPGQAPRP